MHTPLRMCIACRQMKPKGELIRFVKSENGAELDEKQKKPGRGAYICKNEECIKASRKRRSLAKQFKMPVDEKIFDELSEADNG